MSKPKVLVCVLTGIERHNWISPDLSLNLFQMFRDPRFDVSYFPVRDCRPWEGARNMTICAARQMNADVLLSIDNDNWFPGPDGKPGNPLDIIAAAGPNQDVIGLSYGVGAEGSKYSLFPPSRGGAGASPFREVPEVAGGLLFVRNTVWQKIPRGPWFRWVHADNELLSPDKGSLGEDVYFCRLARQHGLKVWTHQRTAAHYRTTDITRLAEKVSEPSNWTEAVFMKGAAR